MEILIIKTAAIGDVLRTTVLLPALHRHFDKVTVTWITSPYAVPLLSCNPHITHLYSITAGRCPEVEARRFDWVISLDEDEEASRVVASVRWRRLSGVFQDVEGARHYTSDMAEWFGMGLLRSPEEGGLVQANVLKRANTTSYPELLYKCLGLSLSVERPQLILRPASVERMRQWMLDHCEASSQDVIGVNSGAGARWRYKRLSEEKTADVARSLAELSRAVILLLGGEDEAQRNARIERACANRRIISGPSVPLEDFAALIGCCDVVLSSDSLAMHIAISLGIPVTAFFGPTSAAEIEVFNRGTKIETPLSCRTCYLANCDQVPNCMDAIETTSLVSETLRAVKPRNVLTSSHYAS